MSQEIINKCDLCKTIIPHEDTIWTVGVLTSQRKQGGKQLAPSHHGLASGPAAAPMPALGTVNSSPAKSLECCRKCMENRFQLIPQQAENKDTLPPTPSLEDLITDIAESAVHDYNN